LNFRSANHHLFKDEVKDFCLQYSCPLAQKYEIWQKDILG
jgi:hypothetical protein